MISSSSSSSSRSNRSSSGSKRSSNTNSGVTAEPEKMPLARAWELKTNHFQGLRQK